MSAIAKSEGLGSRRAWRVNAWTTALLAVLIIVAGNHLARTHLSFERDLSEDQLFAPSPVGVRMIGELDDILQVRAYFTVDVKSGTVQIAKRRLMDQLEEYADASAGRMQVVYLDPSTSSEARAEATALGIAPYPARSLRGTSIVSQDVWLGLALRYRGREAVVPMVVPQIFEYAFLSNLRKLTRESDVTIGFLVGRGEWSDGDDEFTQLRTLLSEQYRLREVYGLAGGDSVPEDVSVLVVARPTELHPRAVFEIDQFVQRGGRVLLLAERADVDLSTRTVGPIDPGLDALLAAWGVRLGDGFLWDQGLCEHLPLQVNGKTVQVPFPFWPRLPRERLDRSTPVTAQLAAWSLFWAHPLEVREVAGLSATRLAWTSPDTFVVNVNEGATLDPEALRARAADLLTRAEGEERTVALSLSGRFPSPFADGAPAPFDPIEETLRADRERRRRAAEASGEAGAVEPEDGVPIAEEKVLSAEAESQVVIVSDATWASVTKVGSFLNDENRLVFVSLVDWLALEDDLLALRARLPRERRIDDFLAEERSALGLVGERLQGDLGEESESMRRLETQAERRAEARRWRTMAAATGGALLAALAGGALVRIAMLLGARTGGKGRSR